MAKGERSLSRAVKQYSAAERKSDDESSDTSVAPQNQGVTKKDAERILKKLHLSKFRIPDVLKIR